ncbi:MAG: helix-turn-helix domain-containing protein [Rhizomicrobium sp.]
MPHNTRCKFRDENWSRITDDGRITLPVGNAEAALLLENQPNVFASAVELLTADEAAEFLTISVSGMRRLQHGRTIPFFKVGGSLRFAKSDLVSYLTKRRVGSVGQ